MKIDNRTFKFAGSSADPDGSYKARFANDQNARPKVMQKCGHSNFVLVALPTPMTKIDAIKFLLETKPEGVNLEALEAKAVYINKQVAKLSGNGTGAKRGRPVGSGKKKTAVAQTAETVATVNSNLNETPTVGSTVNTIVNAVRGWNSIRAKAAAPAAKAAAAKR